MLSSTRTWIGVVVAVAGNVTISLALNCQKLAHTRLQEGQHVKQYDDNEAGASTSQDDHTHGQVPPSTSRNSSESSVTTKQNGHAIDSDPNAQDGGKQHGNGMDTMFLHSKLWWLGLALMTLGEAGNFISYGFAPASLVAPLGAVALLSNVIISPILLGERFRISDIGGILLAIIGAVTVVFSSKQNDVRLDPAQLLQAIKRLEFAIYTAVSVLAGALLAFASSTSFGDRWVLVDVGTCAIFGGFTVLSTKGISSLISGGQPIEALKFPITYALVVVLAVTAMVQITYLNRALQRFDSREVIPSQFVCFTISAIVGSAILYRDFENMDAHRLINFLFGCLTTFGGVFVLTWRNGGSRGGGDGGEQLDDESGEESLAQEAGVAEGGDESEALLSSASHRSELGRGRVSASNKGKPRRIEFLEPAFNSPGRSDALRVPVTTKASPSRRPRSRTNSPHNAATRLSDSWDRDSAGLSRSASNQPSAGLLSSSAGLRTPKLSLMSIDRPTGLSSGHYLLLATPPPSFTLNPVAQPVAGARSAIGRGTSQYGSVGKSAGVAFLPLPVTARGQSSQSTPVRVAEDATSPAATSAPMAAETIATPVMEPTTPQTGTNQDLTDRLVDQVSSPREGERSGS